MVIEINMVIVSNDNLPLSPLPKVRGLKKFFFLGPSTERSIACVVWLNKSSSNSESSERRQQRLDSSPPWCCFQTSIRSQAMLLTAELEITVVHGHIPGNLHVAPRALRVIVRVAALVWSQRDFWDELLVYAQNLHHGCWPRQTHMASQTHIKITGVVQAVVGQTIGRFDNLGSQGSWHKLLTFREHRDKVPRLKEEVILLSWTGISWW